MTAPRCTLAPSGAAAEAALAMRVAIPRLETGRLVLRAPEIPDLAVWTPAFMESFAEPGDTEERAWEEFSYYTACWLLHGFGMWTVERKADGATIGFVTIGLEWDDEEPELGYLFAAQHRGQGYAAEAATVARDHGVQLLGAGAFVSYVDPENAPSNRLAARLGARRDGAAEADLMARAGERIHIWRHGVADA